MVRKSRLETVQSEDEAGQAASNLDRSNETKSRKLSTIEKSPDAFRTISEVAEEVGVPTHVLRFWETKFPIHPLKRAGGRRYYRREDINLVLRIKELLYVDKYTIKGAQNVLRSRNSAAAPSNEIGLQSQSDSGRSPEKHLATSDSSKAIEKLNKSLKSISADQLKTTEVIDSLKKIRDGLVTK